MKQILETIINKAALLGLPSVDINNAQDFLKHHEFGLCLEIIIGQAYEHNIKIDKEFYLLVMDATQKMNIPAEKIDFIKELLRKT